MPEPQSTPNEWNPADTHVNLTLSNNNLTATRSAGAGAKTRGKYSKTSGKWYFEIKADSALDSWTACFGVGASSVSLGIPVGNGADWGYSIDGNRRYNGTSTGGYSTWGTGDVIMVALNLDNNKLWFGLNGTWQGGGDPAADTSPAYTSVTGTLFPAASLGLDGEILTARFASADFSYTPPTGFTAMGGPDLFSAIESETLALSPNKPNSLVANTLTDHLPAASLLLAPTSMAGSVTMMLPAESLDLAPMTPASVVSHTLGSESLLIVPRYVTWDRAAANVGEVSVVYALTLTGAADATTDIVLPLSSFQSRLRDGDPSYLSVVVPNATAWSAAINARKNGDLVIHRGVKFPDGSTQLEELARVALETITIDEGAASASATLTGHKTTSATVPQTRALTGASYKNTVNGARRFRAEVDNFLRPGDTVQINNESLVVGSIVYTIDPLRETMEIVEAAA